MIKNIVISISLLFNVNAAVIDRAEFIDYKFDSINKRLIFKISATPLSWLNFYHCNSVYDIGKIEKSTYLGGWYFLDLIEEASFLPHNIGFYWINSTSTPIYR